MENPTYENDPVTVVVTWRIRPGREREFEVWRREISAAALEFPGHMGIDVVLPVGSRREYAVMFRFDTYEHLHAWQESEIRRNLLKKAEPFSENGPSYRLQTGLEYWFAPSDASTPPRWKMAIVTVIGVWPVSMVVPWLLNPLIASQSPLLQSLCIAVGIVTFLTWAVMPVLVKILRPWLENRP